jgi:hypothetical protein
MTPVRLVLPTEPAQVDEVCCPECDKGIPIDDYASDDNYSETNVVCAECGEPLRVTVEYERFVSAERRNRA